jgi:hypothetical protein
MSFISKYPLSVKPNFAVDLTTFGHMRFQVKMSSMRQDILSGVSRVIPQSYSKLCSLSYKEKC